MIVRVTGDPETPPQSASSGWESLIWPRWLPLQARLPLHSANRRRDGARRGRGDAEIGIHSGPLSVVPTLPPGPPIVPASALVAPAAPAATAAPARETVRPAHLNLDVRHSLRSVDLSVTVDGKSVLETKLGRERQTLRRDWQTRRTRLHENARRGPRRAHASGSRVRSADSNSNQTRVERFNLDSASVAAMRIAADRVRASRSWRTVLRLGRVPASGWLRRLLRQRR